VVLVVGVMSWEVEVLKKLPALAVMVGMTDAVAQSVLGSVGNCDKGMICCDGVVKRDPKPACWPCIAASKTVYSSCSVVDRFVWHQQEGEPAEGMFIAQLGCRGSVCGSTEVTVCVFACGPHTSFNQAMCEKTANKMAAWGLHMLVGMKACDRGTRGHGELSFQEHIPFVERTLRLPPMANVRSRHFTSGGSVVWAFGSTEDGKTVWFLHDSIRCKPWQAGTIARCGARDKERSTAAMERRWGNQQKRMQNKSSQWVKPCRRADPVRTAIPIVDGDF
jgi:hypothetical protein